MSTYQTRLNELVLCISLKASGLPVLESGLWFHKDIRDNFYYASYLFAAAGDPSLPVSFDRGAAKEKASGLLLEVLALQDQNPESPTYGHWPLNLGSSPQQAKANTLPVELMGSLMMYFFKTYGASFSGELRGAFETALEHVYRSPFYRKPLQNYHHHEAKYTAAKLIFGYFYEDRELLEDGHRSLIETLQRIRTVGMSEYGCLPWFWHWVQVFTCAWKLIDIAPIKQTLADMLDYLWTQRSLFYLQGTWVGAQSRSLPHDSPRDGNSLLDYVQFGDFPLPDEMPRTEYAGFLFYEAPEHARRQALDRAGPVEVKQLVPGKPGDAGRPLHSYVYITRDYASGGIWERAAEFDNEQRRWDVTLPLRGQEGVNQAFFFHPGTKYTPGDPRHESEFAEVLFHRNVIAALYPIPDDQPGEIVGCLPVGSWIQQERALYALCQDVYFAVYLLQPFEMVEETGRVSVKSQGSPNGVVVEVLGLRDAGRHGVNDLAGFLAAMRGRQPVFTAGGKLSVQYHSLNGDTLLLQVDGPQQVKQSINGAVVDFSGYVV